MSSGGDWGELMPEGSELPDGAFVTARLPVQVFAEAHLKGEGRKALAFGLAKCIAELPDRVLAGLAAGEGLIWMDVRLLATAHPAPFLQDPFERGNGEPPQ